MAGPRATDEVPGLGRVEQLVLRTDGLTTISMEVLTGVEIMMDVYAHWVLPVHDELNHTVGTGGSLEYTGVVESQVIGEVHDAITQLCAQPAESLLIREVVHRGSDGHRYGVAVSIVVLDRLPQQVARTIAQSDEPIGRALKNSGLQLSRQLMSWGLEPAGRLAERLSGDVRPRQAIPARTYMMTADGVTDGIGIFYEWYAPLLFIADEPSGRATQGRRTKSPAFRSSR